MSSDIYLAVERAKYRDGYRSPISALVVRLEKETPKQYKVWPMAGWGRRVLPKGQWVLEPHATREDAEARHKELHALTMVEEFKKRGHALHDAVRALRDEQRELTDAVLSEQLKAVHDPQA